MPRIAKTEVAQRLAKTAPRLVVVNSSTSNGRMPVMLRVRPTILQRLQSMTVGPTYLLIEHALEKLMDELEQLPPGMMQSIDAITMDPGPEDHEAIDQVPTRRGGNRKPPGPRSKKKAGPSNAGDDQASRGANGDD